MMWPGWVSWLGRGFGARNDFTQVDFRDIQDLGPGKQPWIEERVQMRASRKLQVDDPPQGPRHDGMLHRMGSKVSAPASSCLRALQGFVPAAFPISNRAPPPTKTKSTFDAA
jgi:hypothetical protein